MKLTKKPLALMIAAAAAMTSGQAAAQWAIEEVVVTAQKRAQSANDIGLSVSAFTGEMMEKMGVTQTSEIAAQTPGLETQSTFGNSYPAFVIRGVGINDYNPNSNPGVAVYVDEASVPSPPMLSFGLFDIERAEVLKGPQGTLYGKNTTGGAVSIHTVKPSEETEGYIKVEAGNYDHQKIEGAVGGSITDSIQGRIAGFSTKQDEGYNTAIMMDTATWTPTGTTDDMGRVDQEAFRGQLAFDINDDMDALLRYTYGKDKSDVGYYRNEAMDGVTDTPSLYYGDFSSVSEYYSYTGYTGQLNENEILMGTAKKRPKLDNTLNSYGLNFNWDLGFATVNSVTAYDDFEYGSVSDWASTEQIVQEVDYTGTIKNFSQELRLTSNEGELVDWIVGLYYSDTETKANSALGQDWGVGWLAAAYGFQSGFGLPAGATNVYTQNLASTSAFINTEWHVSEQVKLTAGVRYTEDELEYDMALVDDGSACVDLGDLLPDGPGGPCGDITTAQAGLWEFFETAYFGGAGGRIGNSIAKGAGKVKEESVPWRLAVDYTPTDDSLLYVSVSNGFKAQGFFGGLAPYDVQFQPYAPEELLAIEAGFKVSLLDNTMQINGATFTYDYKDQQVAVGQDIGLASGNLVLSNIAKSEINGAELDIQWLPLDGLTLNIGGSYLNTKVTDNATSSPLPLHPSFEIANGAELANAPKWSYNALARYEMSVTDALVASFQLDANYRTELLSVIGTESSRVDDLRLVNARVSLGSEDGTWEVAGWVKNLEDKKSVVWRQILVDSMALDGAPRTWGVNVKYNF